jgi:23S rRNA G2069 N7-methylase RlmK/C1962 C5-methylase RlmI
LTGRTHQVRAHAAQAGFPILGDLLYEGTPAPRVFLHAAELVCHHPATGEEVVFRAPAHFERGGEARVSLRGVLIRAEETNAWRLVHGAADGWPGWYVDRLGDRLLSEAEQDLSPAQRAELARLGELIPARGLWHKVVTRHAGRLVQAAASPQPLVGEPARQPFVVRENGLQFELSFSEGYAVGLFLDQRDNRRRLLTGHVGAGFEICRSCGPTNSCRAYHKNLSAAPHARAERRVRQVGAATKLCCTYDKDRYGSASAVSPPGGAPFAVGGAGSSGSPPARLEVLNVFAYTCAFSVCAAKAGARTTSLDLSKKYLDWGKRNFALNQLDAAGHEFIYGDAWDWLRRLARRGRRFDVVLLDPPTFSRSRDSGVFRAERDYGRLAGAALPLLRPGGVLFASTNAAGWPPEEFLQVMSGAVKAAGRSLVQSHYAPQPPDFPVARAEPAYLKTVWLRVG